MVPVLLAGIRLESQLLDFGRLGLISYGAILRRSADVLLGMHQGLTWGLNITCLMDILGPKGYGMASGLSNAVGYAGSALTAPFTAKLVADFGDQHGSEVAVELLAACMALGLFLVWRSRDTGLFVCLRSSSTTSVDFARVSTGCGREADALCSLAGLTVNLVTGLVWGSTVLWSKSEGGLNVQAIGFMEAWHTSFKILFMISAGYAVYFVKPTVVAAVALVILFFGLAVLWAQALHPPADWFLLLLATGITGAGVGGAFPALAAAVTSGVSEDHRASVYGAYRFWRDLGYAMSGLVARMCDWDGFRSSSATVFVWTGAVASLFSVRMVLCSSRHTRTHGGLGDAPSPLLIQRI